MHTYIHNQESDLDDVGGIATQYFIKSVFRSLRHVTRFKPAVLVEGFGRFPGSVFVILEHTWTLHIHMHTYS